MPDSTLIQPVISTEATGTSAFPDVGHLTNDIRLSADSAVGVGWTVAARQWKQDALNSVPLILADLLALATCLYLGAFLALLFTTYNVPMGIHTHMLTLAVAYLSLASQMGLFPAAGISPVFEVKQQVTASFFGFMLLLIANGVFGKITVNEVLMISIAIPLSAVCMPVLRYLARAACARFSWWGQPVIIVGASKPGMAVYHHFERAATRGLRPIGLVDESPHHYWRNEACQDDPTFLGTLDQFDSLCRKHNVFSAIAVLSDRTSTESRRVLAACSQIPNLIVLSNRLYLPSLWNGACDFAGLSGIRIKDQLLSPRALIIKRAADIFVSLFLLLLTIPFFLLVTIVLKYKSPGPTFYGHPRTGRRGKRFKAWKIRTMVPSAADKLEELLASDPEARAEWNSTRKLQNDPRIIRGFIHFLRKTSLDELPQLWNVLKGEMSLVGPRPLPDDEIEIYEMLPVYKRVRPGMTGLWQVSGRNKTSYNDKVQLDTYYVRNWSLWLDYYILLRTVRAVLLKEGAC